jgi:DNA repair exonuclease SbcCD ATPase subunit
MERSTLASIRGTTLPNPEYFGFRWREAQKLLEEHHRLRNQGRQIGQEHEATKQEIKRLEDELRQQRALALRGSSLEPDEKPLEEAKAHLETFGGRVEDLRRAADMVNEDLQRVVADNREKWAAQVEEKGSKALARREQLFRQLAVVDYDLGVCERLVEWLEDPSPTRDFAAGPAPDRAP